MLRKNSEIVKRINELENELKAADSFERKSRVGYMKFFKYFSFWMNLTENRKREVESSEVSFHKNANYVQKLIET